MNLSWQNCSLAQSVESLYGASSQPVAVVDGGLLVVWANSRALSMFGCLRMPDGIHCLLDGESVRSTAEALSVNRSCTARAMLLPLGVLSLFFSPLSVPKESAPFALVQFFQPTATGGMEGAPLDATQSQRVISAYSGQIRIPLSTVFASLGTLSNNRLVRENSALQRPLQNINQQSYRILRHCVNLTEFTRFCGAQNPLETENTDLTEFLREQCKSAQILAAEIDIPLTYSLPDKTLYCACDRRMLENALFNIISNSCKFTRPGNTISVSLEQADQVARITVTDHGQGISQRDMPHIFEPFYSSGGADPLLAGGGLGLTVSKLCVAAHGGSIAVQSSRSATTVALTLPLCPPPEAPPLEAPCVMDMMCDRFSLLHVLLSDACKSPWP